MCLGKGFSSRVILAHFFGQLVAVKQMSNRSTSASESDSFRSVDENNSDFQAFLNEATILAPLSHVNIIDCFGVCYGQGPGSTCLVMEFLSHGDLGNAIPFSFLLTASIASAVSHITDV